MAFNSLQTTRLYLFHEMEYYHDVNMVFKNCNDHIEYKYKQIINMKLQSNQDRIIKLKKKT